jgi:hydroxypyruvate isomerase
VSHALRFDVNCSMLFTEIPLRRRPAAAKAAGFDAVEFWWPWPDEPVPSDSDVDGFVTAIQEAGVELIGLNFFAGDLAGPDCGVLSIPSRSWQFRDNIEVTVGIGERLGVRSFNALYGNRIDDVTPEKQDELATENLAAAAAVAGEIGAAVLVESVSGSKPYPLRNAEDAVAVVNQLQRVGVANVGFLADLYHLASNGDDVPAAIAANIDSIAHVQIADAPGRGQPGTGDLPLDAYLTQLEQGGYSGWVGLEYKPVGSTDDSISWLPRARRSAGRSNAREGLR